MAKQQPLEPAAGIIEACGGTRAVADFLRLNRVTVWRWMQPKPKGTGGFVPSLYHRELLAWARETGKALREAHFFSQVPPARSEAKSLRRVRLRWRSIRVRSREAA